MTKCNCKECNPDAKVYILLDHPCFEVDLWHTVTEEESDMARQQEYLPLEYVRNVIKY